MKNARLRGAIFLAAAAVAALPALAQEVAQEGAQETVPYAMRPSPGDAMAPPFVPTLGDIMGAVQLRHFKLWQAGKLRNWDLAIYELGQIGDSLGNAARLYRNIPIEKIQMVADPLTALENAAKAKDGARFTRAFDDLTTACNACHEAANVGFITMQAPTSSAFSNQSFAPKRK